MWRFSILGATLTVFLLAAWPIGARALQSPPAPFSEIGPGQDSQDVSGEPGSSMRWRRRSALDRLRDPELQERLGLTPEQLERLEQLVFDTRQRQIQLRAELQQQRLELGRLLRQEPLDRATIERTADQISQVQTELGRVRLNWRLDSLEVLSPDQREELRTLLRERSREAAPRARGRRERRSRP